MKTTIIEKTVYNYSDLLLPENLGIKEKVIERFKNSDSYLDYEWWSYEEFYEDANKKGFDIDKIYFSGFYSQGDGAMFEGDFRLNFDSEIELIKSYVKNNRIADSIKKGTISVYCSFKHYGHYYHEKSYKYSFDIETNGNTKYMHCYPNIESALEFLESDITSDYESFCSGMYSDLKKQWDYLNSEESILEHINANEYEFDQNGKII